MIDAAYRGELKVILLNTDREREVRISRGDRIAQLVLQRVSHASFRTVDSLPESVRGVTGHGASGRA